MLQWLLIFIAGLLLGNYIRRKKRSSMLSTAPAQPLPNAGEILKSSGIDPRFIFGQQVGSETSLAALPAIQESDMPYAQAILRATNMPTVQFLKPLLDRRNEVLILTLHDFIETVIEQRREAASLVPLALQLYDELGQKRLGQTWLEELIQSILSICEKEDGDTNSRGSTLCLYEISDYASVQQGEGDEEDKALSMPALEYLECVHPPPPEAIFDCSLKENMDIRGKLIPPGTNLIVGIYALLRDPHEHEAYHELHKHDKQSQQKQLKPYINPFANILAFAAGPSNCIGHKYAGLQMKCVISRVLQNYKLQPLPLRPASSPFMPRSLSPK